MATRLIPRKKEHVEKLHDIQDGMMSKEDQFMCNFLRAKYNALVLTGGGKGFSVHVPPWTSEMALNCFVYATKRVGEVPIVLDGRVEFR